MSAAPPVRQLLVEGWRCSSHSYALVNQHQLLELARDPRLALYHRDLPLWRPEWRAVDAGFATGQQAALARLGPPPRDEVDIVYRISWPLRVFRAPARRVLVFGTAEFLRLPADAFCGPDGSAQGADPEAVEMVTPSQWSKAGLVASGFAADRVHVIPHGIDPALFEGEARREQRQRVRAALGIPDDAFVFLNIGSMTWNKGIGLLLAAFARHLCAHPSAVLVLKGGDSLYGNFLETNLAEARSLAPEVARPEVAGALRYVASNLPQAALASLYRACDAYIAPYRAEGFNLPVLESLAAGTPVIVTAGGSTDDFCPSEGALRIPAAVVTATRGCHLEPALESIVDCMAELADTVRERRAALARVRATLLQRYSWRAIAQALADLMLSDR